MVGSLKTFGKSLADRAAALSCAFRFFSSCLDSPVETQLSTKLFHSAFFYTASLTFASHFSIFSFTARYASACCRL